MHTNFIFFNDVRLKLWIIEIMKRLNPGLHVNFANTLNIFDIKIGYYFSVNVFLICGI